MSLDLGAKKKSIDFTVYGDKYSFEVTEKSINNLKDGLAEVEYQVEKVGEDPKKAKEVFAQGFDAILGVGASYKIFSHEDDLLTLMQTFMNVGDYLVTEYNKLFKDSSSQKATKIIASKKR